MMIGQLCWEEIDVRLCYMRLTLACTFNMQKAKASKELVPLRTKSLWDFAILNNFVNRILESSSQSNILDLRCHADGCVHGLFCRIRSLYNTYTYQCHMINCTLFCVQISATLTNFGSSLFLECRPGLLTWFYFFHIFCEMLNRLTTPCIEQHQHNIKF